MLSRILVMATLGMLVTAVTAATTTAMAQPPDAQGSGPWWQSDAARGEADPGGAAGGEAESGEATWVMPPGPAPFRYIVLRGEVATQAIQRAVSGILETLGTEADDQGYRREARRRGLGWNNEATYAQLLGEASIDLIVVVDATGRGSGRRLRLEFRHGRTGELVLVDEVFRGGDHGARIRRDASLVWAHIQRDNAGQSPPPISHDGAPEDGTEDGGEVGSAVNLRLDSGLGVGGLTGKIPSLEGTRTLSLGAFFVVDLGLEVAIEPTAGSAWALLFDMSYRSSMGLRTRDRRGDGSIRSATARAQRFELAAGVRRMLGANSLDLVLGYALRNFHSAAELSFPDHTLSGPFARALVSLPLWQDGLALVAGTELQYIVDVERGLLELGVGDRAWALGWVLGAGLPIGKSTALDLVYRESFAWLSMVDNRSGHSDERFVSLRLRYEP